MAIFGVKCGGGEAKNFVTNLVSYCVIYFHSAFMGQRTDGVFLLPLDEDCQARRHRVPFLLLTVLRFRLR